MDRRLFLSASAALAAGGAVAGCARGAAAAGPAARAASSGADTWYGSLQGEYLDLTSMEGNREAFARLMGNLDMSSTKYGWADGIVQGVRPGEAVRDLVGFKMLSTAKLLPHEDGNGYRKVLREIGLYTDLETGDILEEWRNPYLNETVKVVPIANDPFNSTITDYWPDPPSYGGLNQEVRERRPFVLDWTRRGDMAQLFMHINLFYPSALQPAEWPRESGSPFAQVTENFLYQIPWEDLQNPQLTSVEYHGTWSRTTPWFPWMLMGPTPGHMQYQTFMGAVDSLDKIDPKVVAYVSEMYPKFLTAPDRWEEPSLSSLEWYARQQTPAPVAEGQPVPQAPEPELPAWFQAMMRQRQQGQ